MTQDTTFIGRSYHLPQDVDFTQNIQPHQYDINSNESIEVEEQYSYGKLIGWTIITTWN